MHRTQLYITDLQYRFLLAEARRANSSLSELVRSFIQQRITASSRTRAARKEIIGIATADVGDVSINHDKYLYS